MKTIETKEPSADGIRAHKLMCAVMKNDLEAFKNLFTHGTQVILIPSPESLKILNEREHTNIPEDRCALTLAIQIGRLEVVDYVMQNIQINTKFQEYIFRYAIQHHQLGVVKLLLEKYGIRYKSAIAEAVTYDCGHHYEDKDITLYLLEHNDDGFFDLYCDKEYNSYKREYVYIPPTSILRMAVCNASCRYPGQGWHVVVDAIATRYLQLLHETHGYLHDGYTPVMMCLSCLDAPTLRVLKKHLGYIDVNQILLGEQETVLRNLIRHSGSFGCNSVEEARKLHDGVKFLVAYGADVGPEKITSIGYTALLQITPSLEIWDRWERVRQQKEELAQYANSRALGAELLSAYDKAVEEGKEIWEWNQGVMREVVKWSGCVMRGDMIGLGKRAGEALVKFAPAQFEEKLEVGMMRLLRAQTMLETGHGVAFGDMHHGGYVKYVGTTSKGVTLHGWNATVTCDYHIDVRMHAIGTRLQMDVRMKTWEDAKIQHNMGHNVSEVGKGQHSVSMMRVVWIGGDSHVDCGVTVMTDMRKLALYTSTLLCTNMEEGETYNRELYPQTNCTVQYAPEHAQKNETMHMLGKGNNIHSVVSMVMDISEVELRAHDKQGQYLHVWGGCDVRNQKLQAQQQWYLATGEFLPTLAGVIQLHDDTMQSSAACEESTTIRNQSTHFQHQQPNNTPLDHHHYDLTYIIMSSQLGHWL